MNHFGTEVRRGLARRSTRVLLAIAVLGVACIGIGVFVSHESTFDPVAARAKAAVAFQQSVQQCIDNDAYGEAGPVTGDELRRTCESFKGSPNDLVEDERFRLTTLWKAGDSNGGGLLSNTAFFLLIGALIGGATFIGAEWRFGTFGTLLTWDPRRLRVFFAKVAAAAAITLVVGVVLQALVALAVMPSALWRGTTDGVDAEWLTDATAAVVRISFAGVIAALVGFAIASIGRNTAAALGAAFAWFAVGEGLIRGLKPEWQPWLAGENLSVLVTGKVPSEASFDRTLPESSAILTVYLAVILVAAAVVFLRRDVT